MQALNKKTTIIVGLLLLITLSMAFLFTGEADSAARNPFLGHWFAVDSDGSKMGLNLLGVEICDGTDAGLAPQDVVP